MRSIPKLIRARKSPSGRLPLSRYGALAGAVMASLSYPLAIAPKTAMASPLAPQQADPPISDPVAIGVQLANTEMALAQSQDQIDAAEAQLRAQAVNSYVEGGSARFTNDLFQGPGGYDTSLRKEYLATLTGSAQDAYRRLAGARSGLDAAKVRLERELQLSQTNLAQAVSAPGGAALADQGLSPSLAINGPVDFAIALLRTLGDPVTPQNLQALVAWHKAEGGAWNSPAKFNPFNTSMKMPGSHAINGAGVQAYTSWAQGLTATVATLNGSSYRRILAALSAGSSTGAVESAVASSPWGTHFYS